MESGGKENGGGRVGDGGRNQSKASSTKSCKGYLMYNSDLRSKGRCPRCFGVSRTLPSEPGHILRHTEVQASKEGRRLIDFYYVCVGYGLYRDGNNQSTDKERAEVPSCLGFELVVENRAQAGDTASPASLHNKEGFHPQTPQTRKPVHFPGGDDFYSRFARNAGLVASGVTRNMKRVGNYVKQNIDDILDRRPK